MSAPPYPANESGRLAALRRYHILDTPAEEAFDDLTRRFQISNRAPEKNGDICLREI